MNSATRVKDLNIAIAEIRGAIENLQKNVGELESYPVIHEDLRSQIRSFSRVLFYLERCVSLVREEKSRESEVAALSADFKELLEQVR